ncbi:hypothetical protein D3C81_2017670 [compost metagenome]
MFGVEHQRGVHRLFPAFRGPGAMQQMEEMAANRVVIGFRLDAFAVVAIVIPVQQHGTERGQEFVGDIAGARGAMRLFLRQHAAQCGDTGTHDVHGVRGGGQRFQHRFNVHRHFAQRF